MRRLQWVGVRREMVRLVHEWIKTICILDNDNNMFDTYNPDLSDVGDIARAS